MLAESGVSGVAYCQAESMQDQSMRYDDKLASQLHWLAVSCDAQGI